MVGPPTSHHRQAGLSSRFAGLAEAWRLPPRTQGKGASISLPGAPFGFAAAAL